MAGSKEDTNPDGLCYSNISNHILYSDEEATICGSEPGKLHRGNDHVNKTAAVVREEMVL
jgi:hypothetical protein